MREAMDNFIDSFLSSPSWSDMNASRSWAGSIASQTDSLLADSMGSYQSDVKNSTMPVPSSHITRNMSAEVLNIAHVNAPSMFNDGSLKYGLSKGLFLAGNGSKNQQPNYNSQPSHVNEAHEGSNSIPDPVTCNSATVSYGLELNASLPYSALTISSSLDSNSSEPSNFGQSIREAHSISSVPTIWPPSYTGISPITGQEKAENFSFQGIANAANFMQESQNEHGLNSVTFPSGQQIKMNRADSQPHNQVVTGVTNLQLPSFSSNLQMSFSKASGIQPNEQPEEISFKHQLNHSSSTHPQMTQANVAVCNIAAKPRVRARRGQATDPHSIAERLRREKIAERMKNLQELVPNSNKTDKASMLDEIIDYVKFLQLQVKVLSMSRLGAAGAVVPLITDVHAEDTKSLHLSPISRVDLFESQDDLAFEQEVVKLMESNVTTAMQYLQNKGLCLMPIALASAISNQKDSASDRRTQDGGERIVLVKQEELTRSMGDGGQSYAPEDC